LLEEEEIEVEILLPSLLAPISKRTLTAWLSNRERIVVAEESHSAYGFGAELGALLAEEGYRGRFLRIGTPPVPIPAARSLEVDVIPDERAVMRGVVSLFV